MSGRLTLLAIRNNISLAITLLGNGTPVEILELPCTHLLPHGHQCDWFGGKNACMESSEAAQVNQAPHCSSLFLPCLTVEIFLIRPQTIAPLVRLHSTSLMCKVPWLFCGSVLYLTCSSVTLARSLPVGLSLREVSQLPQPAGFYCLTSFLGSSMVQ
jgi:hypothetical protein